MSDKKIYVPIGELLTSAGGLHTYNSTINIFISITCPDCGDSVHVAENLLLETSCRCREWELVTVVEALGTKITNHLPAGEE